MENKSIEPNPLVTINILSFNRKEELRQTLTKVYEQDYKNIEAIVVDNASSDGTQQMVKTEFPDVNLIELKENIGIAGWNKGFEVAIGEYVLVLDDDAYPDKNSINQSIIQLKKDLSIACITLNTIDLNTNNTNRTSWLPMESINECYWPIFVGCAAFFRKEYFENNPMPPDYFIYQHELPVAAKIYNNGYKIYYSKKNIAFHYYKDENKYNLLADKFAFKNNLNFISTYLPFYLSIFYWLQSVLFYFSRSINKKWFLEYLKILFSKKKYSKNSNKINFKYFLFLRKYHIFNFSLLSKVSK